MAYQEKGWILPDAEGLAPHRPCHPIQCISPTSRAPFTAFALIAKVVVTKRVYRSFSHSIYCRHHHCGAFGDTRPCLCKKVKLLQPIGYSVVVHTAGCTVFWFASYLALGVPCLLHVTPCKSCESPASASTPAGISLSGHFQGIHCQ